MNKKILASLLLPILAVLPFSAQAQDDTISAAALGFMWDNAPSGVLDGNGDGSASGLYVGRRTDNTPWRLERSWFTFTLPTLPEGFEIESVTLQLTLSGTQPGTRTGNVSLYHSTDSTASSVGAALYQNSTFTDTGLIVATPSTPVGGDNPIFLDVTQWVLADYQNDTGVIRSSFRLQNDSLTTASGADPYNIYQFAASGNFVPQLLITYAPIPEPATGALALGAVGLACAFATRRRRA